MNFNKYKNSKKQSDVTLVNWPFSRYLKILKKRKKKSLGKSYGKIVTWHRGGGVARNYRILATNISSKYKYGIIKSIEYDPNRSVYINLIQLQNGSYCYISANTLSQIGDVISFDQNKKLKFGDFVKLRNVPVGAFVYNIEQIPGKGAVYSKAAGVNSRLISKDINYATIRLPSGEEKSFHLDCQVTIGMPSNRYHLFHKKYKAGTNRLLNKRPTVRGVAMNPIDHPHGGGEGKTSGGRPSVSPWGKLTKGVPTRKRNKKNKFIIKFRKKNYDKI